jgi:carbonic anhydrase
LREKSLSLPRAMQWMPAGCCWSRTADRAVEDMFVDPFDRQLTAVTHGVRTACDEPVLASRAIEKLQAGNLRFVQGDVAPKKVGDMVRQALATYGQLPMAAVIGCADSRCPIETLFDTQPGDLFVLRNAGNTITHAEGSMVGSLEFAVGPLKTNLVLVLGHTKCGAIAGATQCAMANASEGKPSEGGGRKSTLETLLEGLGPVAMQAKGELQAGASVEEIAAHAVKVNVFHTIEKLLTYSEPLRSKVSEGKVEVHGAIYDIVTGKVKFLGQSPRLALLLGSQAMLQLREPHANEPALGA